MARPKTIRTLRYHGGKSASNSAGRWIADLLPRDRHPVYCEPFAGMLGVLLQRRPVATELVNDINGDIYNWWVQVRDNHDELARLVALTPYSRQAFADAHALLDSGKGSGVRRAHALHVVVYQSLMAAVDSKHWIPAYTPKNNIRWSGNEFAPLAKRLHNVQLENRDALDVLERIAKTANAVIYCDPPYRTAKVDVYGEGFTGTDWARMAELLKAQKGKCAVSGYNDDWDALGWERHEFTKAYSVLRKQEREPQERTEVLWCNFEVERKQLVLEL